MKLVIEVCNFKKSTAMRKLNLLPVVLTLFLLVSASITWAQTITSQKGLTTAIFPTQYGSIKVYLPDDIRPGETISGTITAEPTGKNPKQVQKNLSELIKYTVSVDGTKINVPEKQEAFKWLVPADRKLTVPLELMHMSGQKVFEFKYEVKKNIITPTLNAQGCYIPSHASVGEPCRITGSFDGDASNTKCSVNNTSAQVLAESPRQCIVRFPETEPGVKQLSITDSKNNSPSGCLVKISAVKMDISAGRLNLLKGEKTQITVQIAGLQGLSDTAYLSLTNKTTDVVKMFPSNFVLIPLTSATSPSGTWVQTFDVQSLKSGSFTVDVNLDLPGEEETPAVYGVDMRDLKNESGYPGSYGYKGDQPCEPEGATIKWRWHKTFPCEIAERKVLPCGHSKEGNDIYEKIKELLEELELDKGTDIGEKMAKAFSTAKTFSYSIHVIRKWVDYDVEYKCVNGKWQSTGGVYVKHGTDDLDWFSVKSLATECWLTFDSPAAEKEFEAALETALRNACK
jgi:hypothetical protein